MDLLDFPRLESLAKKTVSGRRDHRATVGAIAFVLHFDENQDVVFAHMNEPGDEVALPANASRLPSAINEEGRGPTIILSQGKLAEYAKSIEPPVRTSKGTVLVYGRPLTA